MISPLNKSKTYSFSPNNLNSVMSVTHFSCGASALNWQSKISFYDKLQGKMIVNSMFPPNDLYMVKTIRIELLDIQEIKRGSS